jgi:cytochrome c556
MCLATRLPSIASLCVIVALMPAAIRASLVQQDPPASQTPKALVPVAASSVVAQPELYYGQHVTIFGTVDERLSDFAFTIDQDAAARTPKALLVLVPHLNGSLELNAYITVIGQVVRFSPDEIGGLALASPLQLPAHAEAKYASGPAVLATSVITAAMVDLAKKPVPPMTPEEATFDQTMKRVGTAYARLRDANEGPDGTAGALHAGTLKEAFTATEAFWKVRGKADAATWAREARSLCESIERAMSAARWDEAKQATTQLGQRCQSCHGAYRERLDDGGYQIKR